MPPAGNTTTVDRALFDGWKWQSDGIKLLGAPIGTKDFCESVTAKRVAKAQQLLEQLEEYGHAQGALLTLRHCASWCKLVYSARTTPPQLHSESLKRFGIGLRSALDGLLGDSIPDHSWELAQLGLSHGGLGLRDPVRHAPAAYLASLAQNKDLCMRIDSNFDADDTSGALYKEATIAVVQSQVLDAATLAGDLRQKELSARLDAGQRSSLSSRADSAMKAHMSLTRIPGAGAWLTAHPVDDGREIDSPLFKLAVKRRIRCSVAAEDAVCPCCGQIMDRWGDHAATCMCNGDRTVKHNSIRNACSEEAVAGGLRPEKEKAGLLPGRPPSDGLPAIRSARRPADIWVPRGMHGGGEAFDFAVTSGLKSGHLGQVIKSPELVFSQYEATKRQHLSTEDVSKAAGFRFSPLVLESHGGGMSQLTRRFVSWLAGAVAATRGTDEDREALRIAQRMSATLHREGARAILRRLVPVEECRPTTAWAAPAA